MVKTKQRNIQLILIIVAALVGFQLACYIRTEFGAILDGFV